MSDYYAGEKLSVVVSTLASSKKPIKERLLDACLDSFHRLAPDHFSEDLRPRFEAINAKLTAQTSYENTINAMTEDEASAIAEEITTLYALIK